ncbi:transposase [Rhizobium sp. YTU87027]|uniref:transposase n=1 Tax=Rhizobium sp. YTU87027 TaxID=3417741 RepID=UPI003D6943C3
MAHLKRTPHLHAVEAPAQRSLEAAKGQSIAVPGEASFAGIVRELAAVALQACEAIVRIDRDLEPLLIPSLPGMGAVSSAELIANIGTIERFHSAGALASAAGLTPVTANPENSGTGAAHLAATRPLKRALFQSAFSAVSTRDPLSKAFYHRKWREGKHDTQAIIALARRRVAALWTMLRARQTFEPTQKAA